MRLTPAQRDRIMSLHRRAYDTKNEETWWALAKKLECEVDYDLVWKNAQAAKTAGMPKEVAFPLAGEVTRELTADCLPGDLVWWRTVAGVVQDGELLEFDNGTAIVRNSDGRHAVRVD